MHCYWSIGPAKHSVHYGPARHTSGFPWISVSCSLSLKAGLAYTPGKDNTEGANWLQLVPHQTQVQRTAGIETLGLAAGVGSIRVSPCALTPWLNHSPWMEAYRSPDLPLFSLVTEKISISCSLALELVAIWCLRISSLGTLMWGYLCKWFLRTHSQENLKSDERRGRGRNWAKLWILQKSVLSLIHREL